MRDDYKTLKRFEEPGEARYLTWSCYDQLELFNNPHIRDAFLERLLQSRTRLGFKLLAWVVMLEHVHLLIQPFPPDLTIKHIAADIKGPFANTTVTRWKALNARILPRLVDSAGLTHFWRRGGGYDRNTYSQRELREKIDYIHANPVRRGYCANPHEWQWSSAGYYTHGQSRCRLIPDPP
jgi:putative transposase